MHICERNPLDGINFDIRVGQFKRFGDQQEVMHGLVNALAVEHEPERDRAKGCGDLGRESGFLKNLADGGLFSGFARLEMTLRERPHHPTLAVEPPDDGSRHLIGIYDEAACTCFVVPLASPLRPLPRAGHAPSVRQPHTLAP